MRQVSIFAGLLLLQALACAQNAASKACAGCHSEIWKRYQLTGMAQSSGPVAALGAPGGDFQLGEVQFHIAANSGVLKLTFDRRDTDVAGEQQLAWSIGSGSVGRSFLYAVNGFLFQSPVSFYSSTKQWDISPGFQRSAFVNATRPVETGCLSCHATGLRPIAGTQNGYRDPPFAEGGIGCERCHGPGGAHIASQGRGAIVNPAKLSGERRDGVCAQCHLNGAARVSRLAAGTHEFRAGELLSTYSAFFVREGAEAAPLSVTSHFETFAASKCRRLSGEKLWCGTCHDPHGEPAALERAAYYRARCETCHAALACKSPQESRRAAGDDCVGCHMPKSGVRDAQHAVYTDHSIPKTVIARDPVPTSNPLVPFWKSGAAERDLGLAYASLRDPRARPLLEKAAIRDSSDLAVTRQLAIIYDDAGDSDRAMPLYEKVVKTDPSQIAAAVNLGTLYMQRKRAPEAIRLWQGALARNPGLTGTRINLAVAQFQGGDSAAAEASLRQALKLDPDNPSARELLSQLHAAR